MKFATPAVAVLSALLSILTPSTAAHATTDASVRSSAAADSSTSFDTGANPTFAGSDNCAATHKTNFIFNGLPTKPLQGSNVSPAPAEANQLPYPAASSLGKGVWKKLGGSTWELIVPIDESAIRQDGTSLTDANEQPLHASRPPYPHPDSAQLPRGAGHKQDPCWKRELIRMLPAILAAIHANPSINAAPSEVARRAVYDGRRVAMPSSETFG